MKVRNPVSATLLVIVAVGALALAFMVGVILLSTLAIAGVLLGAGLVIRRKLRGSRGSLDSAQSVRASLDPGMEVMPEQPRITAATREPGDDRAT